MKAQIIKPKKTSIPNWTKLLKFILISPYSLLIPIVELPLFLLKARPSSWACDHDCITSCLSKFTSTTLLFLFCVFELFLNLIFFPILLKSTQASLLQIILFFDQTSYESQLQNSPLWSSYTCCPISSPPNSLNLVEKAKIIEWNKTRINRSFLFYSVPQWRSIESSELLI